MAFQRRRPAFEGAAGLYAEDLYRYAYWLCRNRWQAEDLVQETYLRAWRSWAGLREPRLVKSWLFTILYHEFTRGLARTRLESGAAAESEEPYANPDPGLALDLDRALAQLGAESRHALLLQVLGGFSCAEIAQVLGSQEGAVMTRLSRARQALRRTLEPADFGKEAKEG